MKKITRAAALVLVSVMILSAFFGCGRRERNEVDDSLITRFQDACRDLDIKEMLRCFNPTISGPIIALLTLAGLGDTSENLKKVTDLLDNFGDLGVGAEEFFTSITIKGESYEFNDEKDRCTVVARISYGAGEKAKETKSILKCIKKDGEWYFTRISF